MTAAICFFLLAIAYLSRETPTGMPTRRQRRQWDRERYDINPALRRSR